MSWSVKAKKTRQLILRTGFILMDYYSLLTNSPFCLSVCPHFESESERGQAKVDSTHSHCLQLWHIWNQGHDFLSVPIINAQTLDYCRRSAVVPDKGRFIGSKSDRAKPLPAGGNVGAKWPLTQQTWSSDYSEATKDGRRQIFWHSFMSNESCS